MIPAGISKENAPTLLLLGAIVITDSSARNLTYKGDDVKWPGMDKGFIKQMREHFQQTRSTVRNSLMHAEPGSIRLLEDGSIEWYNQKKKGHLQSMT